MQNYLKTISVVALMSSSFTTSAMDGEDAPIDRAPWEAASAARKNMTLAEYRDIRLFLDSVDRAEWKILEVQDEAAWRAEKNRRDEELSLAWIREHAHRQEEGLAAAPDNYPVDLNRQGVQDQHQAPLLMPVPAHADIEARLVQVRRTQPWLEVMAEALQIDLAQALTIRDEMPVGERAALLDLEQQAEVEWRRTHPDWQPQ